MTVRFATTIRWDLPWRQYGFVQCVDAMAMFTAVGDEDKARKSEATASELRERIMKHLWNGQFFRHFLALTPVDLALTRPAPELVKRLCLESRHPDASREAIDYQGVPGVASQVRWRA